MINALKNNKMQLLLLKNVTLGDTIMDKLKYMNKGNMLTTPTLHSALSQYSDKDLFILSENKLFFCKASSGFLESYPLSALPYLLEREEEGGRH